MFISLVVGAVLAVPWLNPFASGPSPSVQPWLVTAVCAVVVYSFRSQLTVRAVVISWLMAALVSACMGVLQYFGLAQGLSPWVHATALGEAFANLRQRNQFATLTSVGLLAVLWCVAERPSLSSARSPTAMRNVLLACACAVLLGLGNAASGSRTGLLQWVLVLALSLMGAAPCQRRIAYATAFALAAYLIAVEALPWALQRVAGVHTTGLLGRFQEEAGCNSRRVLWSNVLHLIIQKPWTGWGWGELDYAHFVSIYPGDRFCDILDNAHNLPMQLAVELGLPVAVVFCALCGWLIGRNKPWAETDPTRRLAWGVLAVIGLHSMLEYPLWYGPFQLAVGLCAWILWQSRATCSRPPKKGALTGIFSMVTSVALVSVGVWAAWDYWRISQLYLLPADRELAYQEQTLDKVKDSWFFQDQVQFAELTTRPLKPNNAATHYAQAIHLLHFSPEPRVIEAVIASAVMLGKDQLALYYLQRYKAAFPDAYAQWTAGSDHFKAP